MTLRGPDVTRVTPIDLQIHEDDPEALAELYMAILDHPDGALKAARITFTALMLAGPPALPLALKMCLRLWWLTRSLVQSAQPLTPDLGRDLTAWALWAIPDRQRPQAMLDKETKEALEAALRRRGDTRSLHSDTHSAVREVSALLILARPWTLPDQGGALAEIIQPLLAMHWKNRSLPVSAMQDVADSVIGGSIRGELMRQAMQAALEAGTLGVFGQGRTWALGQCASALQDAPPEALDRFTTQLAKHKVPQDVWLRCSVCVLKKSGPELLYPKSRPGGPLAHRLPHKVAALLRQHGHVCAPPPPSQETP